jgi:hypothetical protein
MVVLVKAGKNGVIRKLAAMEVGSITCDGINEEELKDCSNILSVSIIISI